jgi:hypothetical protein
LLLTEGSSVLRDANSTIAARFMVPVRNALETAVLEDKSMLKPDLYLKGVLTAIALGLFWIGFNLSTKTVQAQSATRVIITGIEIPNSSGNLPVGIVATRWENFPGGGGGSWKYEPIPVTISNAKPVSVSVAREKPAENPK